MVVTSPATTTSPVVSSVSQATRLAGSPLEHGVEDGVGDLVGHLVGVALGDRLRGEGGSHVRAPLLGASVGDHPIQYRVGHRILGGQRDVHGAPVGVRGSTTALVSWSNPAPGALTSLTTSRSTPLRASLRRPALERIVGLGGEADQHLPGPAPGGQAGQDVGGRLEHQLGDPVLLGQLPTGRRLGRKSATAAAMTTTSAPSAAAPDRLPPCRPPSPRRPASTAPADVGRQGERRRGDQRHRRPAAGRRLGQGVALLARRAVGDEAHRVERLAGAPGADHHPRARAGRAAPVAARVARARAPTITLGSASRPSPESPPARRPLLGRDDVDARGARAWPGCPAPTGAPTSRCAWPGRPRTGARVASRVAVSRSSARPAA